MFETYEQNFKQIIYLIEKIDVDIDTTWKMYITTQLDEASKGIFDLFNSLDKLINYLNSSKEVAKVDTSQVMDIFIALEKSMSVCDYISIADLLKYRLKPLIKQWKTNVLNGL